MLSKTSWIEAAFTMVLAAATIVALTTLAAMPSVGVAAMMKTDQAFRPLLPLLY